MAAAAAASTVRERPIEGLRLLVVGASSGVGRALVAAAAGAGAKVAGAARRTGPVAEALDGKGSVFGCDVRDPSACRRLVRDAAAALGGLDAVVYSSATAPLGFVASLSSDDWADLFATNVFGAALVVSAALDHLRASARDHGGGRVVLFSSDSVPAPYPGLSAYAASKAAIATLARGWQSECPDLRFTVVELGPTATGFADAWPPELAGELLTRWQSEGRFDVSALNDAGDVASSILDLLVMADPPAAVPMHPLARP